MLDNSGFTYHCASVDLSGDTLIASNMKLLDLLTSNITNSVLIGSDIHLENAQLWITGSLLTGEIYVGGPSYGSTLTVLNSTILERSVRIMGRFQWVTLENCIIAPSNMPAFDCQGPQESRFFITMSCCDIYGYEAGSWLQGPVYNLDTTNVYFQNPLSCYPDTGNYHISATSPVHEDSTSCGQIGAYGVGCSGLHSFSLLNPSSDSVFTNTPDQFIWQTTEDVFAGDSASYAIYWGDDKWFGSADSAIGVIDTTYVLPDTLNRSVQYFWRVRAFGVDIPPRFSDETWNFYIDGYPTMPTILSPANGTMADSSTYLIWLLATDPDAMDTVTYTLQIDDSQLFDSPEIDISGITESGLTTEGAVAIRLGDLPGFANLQPGQAYYWRVRSDDLFGPHSDFTDGSNYLIMAESEEIPTLSEWGMIILGLLLLAGGTVALIRRRWTIVTRH